MDNNIHQQLCFDICGPIYRKCYRRKEKRLCKAYWKKRNEIHQVKKLLIEDKFTEIDISEFTEDLLDSKGEDISEAEFIKNEQFFECVE